jgi:hypothetical protein
MRVFNKTGFSVGPAGAELAPPEDSLSPPPLPIAGMTKVRDFVAALARAGKGYPEI